MTSAREPVIGSAPHAEPEASQLSPPPQASEPVGLQPVPAQPGVAHPPHVEVIEDGVLSTRLRRPLDLARMVFGLLLSLVIIGFVWVAATTSADLDQSLMTASRRLPDLVVLVTNTVAGFGLLLLPLAVSVELLVRRRGRQLFDALVGLTTAVTALTLLSLFIEQYVGDDLQRALSGTLSSSDDPFVPLLGGLIAFVTVARTIARPGWNVVTVVVTASLLLVSFISGGLTVVGLALTVIIGWVCGLAVRYVMGTPTTRPSGDMVAQTLLKAGFEVRVLRAEQSTEFGRRYRAELDPGAQSTAASEATSTAASTAKATAKVAVNTLQVTVLDRDLEGAGLASAMWRSLRLRSTARDAGVNMRRTLEQRALMSYASQVDGIPVPRLLLATEVGPDSTLLAYEYPHGVRLADAQLADLDDDVLRAAFAVLGRLQSAHLAHRRLNTSNMLLQPDRSVAVLGISGGTVAASDVAARIDVAELLASLALRVGPDRAISAATEMLGPDGLARALPVLQRVALSPATRKGLREQKGLLNQLRDRIIEARPDGAMEQIQLERVKPRTIITIVLGSVAGYVLLSQLASVDLVGLFRDADWRWLLAALLCSMGTYLAATFALAGFVPERLPFLPTMGAQFAASFATLVSPPTLGTVAINLRYLQKQGVHPALATASIGASQGTAFIMHVLLLVLVAVAAGTQSDLTFDPPRAAVVAVAAGAATTLGLLAIPAVRRWITNRFGPLLRQIGPRLLSVVQQPRKLAEGIGGLLLLNLFYVAALCGCVYAFGGDLSVAAIAVVYLTGSVVGQAAPTPGGLGAVEAALAAGLTAAGLNGGLAVSAVLLFRLLTFWLPTIPGWFSLNTMQKRGLL